MRITFLLPYAGPFGGVRVIAAYAERLQQRGHRVTLLSIPWRPPGGGGFMWALRRFTGRDRGPVELSPLDTCPVEHRVIDRGGSFTDDDVPDGDVVVATWWETAHSASQLSPTKGAKVYFVQDYGAHAGQPMDRIVQTWHWPMQKITISQWLRDLIVQHAGDVPIDLVPNSVDLDLFQAPPRTKRAVPTVGFMYDTRPQKGSDVILDAIRRVRTKRPLEVISFGARTPRPELPLPEGARYELNAPDETLSSIYAQADVWLFASRLEGFGLPILEAMACRTPVIATPSGAAPELVESGGGMLVPIDDAAAMAEAIEQVADLAAEDWQSLSEQAHATASAYTWEHATDQFEAILKEAAAAEGAAATPTDERVCRT